MSANLSFFHAFMPAENVSDARTLLLLHGTGGDEKDLLPIGRAIDERANILSPRGKVSENGMNRFFKRLSEGVFDMDDLHARTTELAVFIRDAAAKYEVNPNKIIAVGYSNGANTAASLLFSHPEVLKGAVLLRAMLPFEPEALPDLAGKSVLILAGEEDSMMPRESTQRLAVLLEEAGAVVTLTWLAAGHRLTEEDIRISKAFLDSLGD
jgi:phospholipase/carboxylesterase